MKVKSRVTKTTETRKHVEIPKAVRDEFLIGEEVYIVKKKAKKNIGVRK